MKNNTKNNSMAFIGYLAVTMLPLYGLTGIIFGVILLKNNASIRQWLGIIIMGFVSMALEIYFYSPFLTIKELLERVGIIFVISIIFFLSTLEDDLLK